jgi:hypothetical protein
VRKNMQGSRHNGFLEQRRVFLGPSGASRAAETSASSGSPGENGHENLELELAKSLTRIEERSESQSKEEE